MYYLPFHNIDFDVEDAFTYGDCWRLAKELHDITGYPIYALGCSYTGPAETERNWCHMFVRLPDGNLLDVRGVWDEEAMLEEWSHLYDDYCDHGEESYQYECLEFWAVRIWEDATMLQAPRYPEEDAQQAARYVLAELDAALANC